LGWDFLFFDSIGGFEFFEGVGIVLRGGFANLVGYRQLFLVLLDGFRYQVGDLRYLSRLSPSRWAIQPITPTIRSGLDSLICFKWPKCEMTRCSAWSRTEHVLIKTTSASLTLSTSAKPTCLSPEPTKAVSSLFIWQPKDLMCTFLLSMGSAEYSRLSSLNQRWANGSSCGLAGVVGLLGGLFF